jgi:hypothetical protein
MRLPCINKATFNIIALFVINSSHYDVNYEQQFNRK